MARSAQLVVNGNGTSAAVAPWVAATNTIGQIVGGPTNGFFYATAAGAYDFYQDVAIPAPDIAAVDAGMFAVDYDADGGKVLAGTTMTMTLKALDGGGGVLTTWSQAVTITGGLPGSWLTHFAVRMQTLPVGTRTVRLGWSGSNANTNESWSDTMTLYFEDVELAATKFQGYAVGGDPPTNLVATKFLAYAPIGAGIGLGATKFIAYGVLTTAPPAPPGPRTRVRLVHMPMVVS